jgi:hypothetical protein
MLSTLRSRVTYPHVVSTLALFLALGTGGAYAANEWTGKNIVDGSLTTADYKNNDIRGADVRNADKPGGGLTGADVASGTLDGGHIADHSLGAAELAFNSVRALEIADNSIDSGEIADNSLLAGDLGTGSVGSAEIASNAVGGGDVANGSLTMADIEGVDSNGTISVAAGIADGRCVDLSLTTPGASVGDVVVLAVNDPVEQGMRFSGVGVRVAGQSIVKACNFTGSSSEEIDHASITLFTLSP